MSLRTVLRQELQARFVKHFSEQGFTQGAVPPDGKWPPDARSCFPLGQLRRVRGNDCELIEIQFDKYRGPSFVVHFGVIPEQGLLTAWGDHIDREDALATDATEACTLYNSSFRMRPFALGFLSSKSPEAACRLVGRLMTLSSEIEAWFSSRSVGKHVRVITGLTVAESNGSVE